MTDTIKSMSAQILITDSIKITYNYLFAELHNRLAYIRKKNYLCSRQNHRRHPLAQSG